MKSNYFALDLKDDKFVYLNQTKLPLEEEYIETTDYERIALAIERLEIRGAPAIGCAAAYGLALALKGIPSNKADDEFEKAFQRLASTRPTAVNLFFALDDLKKIFDAASDKNNIYHLLKKRAIEIHEKDKEYCRKIGENGLKIFRKKSCVLTHCNTGVLATGGEGTAFSVIKTAFFNGLVEKVYADETRPLMQGLRLTSFELYKNGIPFEIICDSAASSLMKSGKVDLVIVGADRIVLNGDTANKIGTYSLAVICNFHNIPFYVAAPTTTIDHKTATGVDIVIEQRHKNELLYVSNQQIAPDDYEAYNPAFDVTPAHLITGIITEEDVHFFPYNFMR